MDTTATHEEQQPVRLHTIISGAADRLAGSVFILPAVLALLFLSLFPLIASLYVSLAKFDIAPGGFKLTFVGLNNYKKLFIGSEGTHFLGKFRAQHVRNLAGVWCGCDCISYFPGSLCIK